jgi:hypothetical protein
MLHTVERRKTKRKVNITAVIAREMGVELIKTTTKNVGFFQYLLGSELLSRSLYNNRYKIMVASFPFFTLFLGKSMCSNLKGNTLEEATHFLLVVGFG